MSKSPWESLLNNEDDENGFVVDLNVALKWLGYTSKRNAKKQDIYYEENRTEIIEQKKNARRAKIAANNII